MPRGLQLGIGIVAVAVGIALTAVIIVVWSPCVGAPMPFDPAVHTACTAVSSGPNTGWIGLLLWPAALGAAGFAAVRAIAHSEGMLTGATVTLLAIVTVLANPMPEYWLLNIAAQSWDEPPGTGSLTALTLMLAGGVLITTRERRVLAPRPADAVTRPRRP